MCSQNKRIMIHLYAKQLFTEKGYRRMTTLLFGIRIALLFLFLGLFHSSARYDSFLSFFLFGLSVFAFYKECTVQSRLTKWSPLFALMAFIYNPIIKIPFDREIWIYLYASTLFLLVFYSAVQKMTKIQNLKKIINEIHKQNQALEKATRIQSNS